MQHNLYAWNLLFFHILLEKKTFYSNKIEETTLLYVPTFVQQHVTITIIVQFLQYDFYFALGIVMSQIYEQFYLNYSRLVMLQNLNSKLNRYGLCFFSFYNLTAVESVRNWGTIDPLDRFDRTEYPI